MKDKNSIQKRKLRKVKSIPRGKASGWLKGF